MDEATLTVKEGELLKILQKHDDNKNEEWWLLAREKRMLLNSNEIRGYVPSNYVELIKDRSKLGEHINSNSMCKKADKTQLSESPNQLNLTDSSFGNESQFTIEYGLAVI